MSHVSPDFVPVFGDCIRMLRYAYSFLTPSGPPIDGWIPNPPSQVLYTKDGQPFLVAGSGTLGWDMASANLVEPGEDVLVLNAGYFGDSFADW